MFIRIRDIVFINTMSLTDDNQRIIKESSKNHRHYSTYYSILDIIYYNYKQ